jgi:hypothetical protein
MVHMRKTICTVLLISAIIYSGCTANYSFTEAENSRTVNLRNQLMSLAKGETKEITGNTQADEGYVLMYGYMVDIRKGKLPLSDSLRSKLADISPPKDYEIYVLVHFRGDIILEYTRWDNDGKLLPYHPNFKTPIIIRGNPYSVKYKNSTGDVELSNEG